MVESLSGQLLTTKLPGMPSLPLALLPSPSLGPEGQGSFFFLFFPLSRPSRLRKKKGNSLFWFPGESIFQIRGALPPFSEISHLQLFGRLQKSSQQSGPPKFPVFGTTRLLNFCPPTLLIASDSAALRVSATVVFWTPGLLNFPNSGIPYFWTSGSPVSCSSGPLFL